jgi:hypothetical protein
VGAASAGSSGDPFVGRRAVATSGEDGTFALPSLPPGSCDVTASKDGVKANTRSGVMVAAGGETRVDFTLGAGGRIAGHVVDASNRPIAHAMGFVGWSPMGREDAFQIASFDDDSFEISGLADGEYKIAVRVTGFVDAIVENVRAGTTNLAVTLVRLAQIVGHVHAPQGAPAIESVSYNLVLAGSVLGSNARVGPDGAFVIGADARATQIILSFPGYPPRTIENPSLSPGADLAVDVDLTTGGAIAGTVVDPAGHPVEGAAVYIQGGASPFALSDAAGRFSIAGVQPGTTRFLATRDGYAAGWSDPITVASGASVDGVVIHLGAAPPGAK